MNREDAYELLVKLIHRIAPEVELDEVDRSAPLQDEIDLDSMDFLNVMTALHEETGIDVPERDYAELSTVDRFVDYVAARGT